MVAVGAGNNGWCCGHGGVCKVVMVEVAGGKNGWLVLGDLASGGIVEFGGRHSGRGW